MEEDALALNLLLQEDSGMRKAAVTHYEVEFLCPDDNLLGLAAHKNKNRKTGEYVFSDPIRKVLEVYIKKLKADPLVSKDRKGFPKVLFESPQPNRRGLPRANFDESFKRVKNALLEDIKKDSALSVDDIKMELKAVERFTQHRIRDLNDRLFKKINATNGQKEKAVGRTPSDTEKAYEGLTIDEMVQLKNRKHLYIREQFPEYGQAINRLIERWSLQC
ncbi:hypothetical protein DXV75_14000 [Alteromonas aestuariivivens]|uniref:Uncharacterized protein n=1 Tax=Alteromonas aestuariivivens TaxID=1938339 RepID=A0A3D8M422_9ALTE|nr:hypothetical protein DXV75_14000 [Alteromonas aestuariivivens]